VGTAALPDPLTNINSRVEFNFNQASVEQFNADFGGGKVTAAGELALFNADASSQTLNINLQNLAVDIPDLYQGDVVGNINLGRTAIEPLLGGEITLSEGEIMLAQGETSPTENGQGNNNLSNVGFNDLTINLGKNVNVTRQPIMNFVADGSLNLNGTLADMRPKGTISLQRGQVNLGPSQFRLAKGYEQTATFTPSQGLDPTLNVRLATSVAETSGSLGNETGVTEPSDGINPSLGTLQSVQVEALVKGRASELQPGQLTANNDVLTLSSDPNRSETEIIALLGGGLTSGFGQGNTALGLANFASSTFLGTFQDTIGDALGLSDFRIFPTLIPTETEEGEEGSSNSTLGFGAEAGIDLSQDLSFSVLTIFNANQPFQYSIRYRFSDDILLRGSTDLADNDSLIIEYETRF
jgi:translocation and assembly module TamB